MKLKSAVKMSAISAVVFSGLVLMPAIVQGTNRMDPKKWVGCGYAEGDIQKGVVVIENDVTECTEQAKLYLDDADKAMKSNNLDSEIEFRAMAVRFLLEAQHTEDTCQGLRKEKEMKMDPSDIKKKKDEMEERDMLIEKNSKRLLDLNRINFERCNEEARKLHEKAASIKDDSDTQIKLKTEAGQLRLKAQESDNTCRRLQRLLRHENMSSSEEDEMAKSLKQIEDNNKKMLASLAGEKEKERERQKDRADALKRAKIMTQLATKGADVVSATRECEDATVLAMRAGEPDTAAAYALDSLMWADCAEGQAQATTNRGGKLDEVTLRMIDEANEASQRAMMAAGLPSVARQPKARSRSRSSLDSSSSSSSSGFSSGPFGFCSSNSSPRFNPSATMPVTSNRTGVRAGDSTGQGGSRGADRGFGAPLGAGAFIPPSSSPSSTRGSSLPSAGSTSNSSPSSPARMENEDTARQEAMRRMEAIRRDWLERSGGGGGGGGAERMNGALEQARNQAMSPGNRVRWYMEAIWGALTAGKNDNELVGFVIEMRALEPAVQEEERERARLERQERERVYIPSSNPSITSQTNGADSRAGFTSNSSPSSPQVEDANVQAIRANMKLAGEAALKDTKIKCYKLVVALAEFVKCRNDEELGEVSAFVAKAHEELDRLEKPMVVHPPVMAGAVPSGTVTYNNMTGIGTNFFGQTVNPYGGMSAGPGYPSSSPSPSPQGYNSNPMATVPTNQQAVPPPFQPQQYGGMGAGPGYPSSSPNFSSVPGYTEHSGMPFPMPFLPYNPLYPPNLPIQPAVPSLPHPPATQSLPTNPLASPLATHQATPSSRPGTSGPGTPVQTMPTTNTTTYLHSQQSGQSAQQHSGVAGGTTTYNNTYGVTQTPTTVVSGGMSGGPSYLTPSTSAPSSSPSSSPQGYNPTLPSSSGFRGQQYPQHSQPGYPLVSNFSFPSFIPPSLAPQRTKWQEVVDLIQKAKNAYDHKRLQDAANFCLSAAKIATETGNLGWADTFTKAVAKAKEGEWIIPLPLPLG
jgi:hypothetical protein